MNEKEKAIARLKENPLDRERWIEAGKAMGWDEHKGETSGKRHRLKCTCILCAEWLYHWQCLIDSLASGGTIEKFFETLLKSRVSLKRSSKIKEVKNKKLCVKTAIQKHTKGN